MSGRFIGAGLLGMAAALGVASQALAQGALPSEAGFQPNRDYLALLPWESIDTGSNNVILTFTDLVLPGNARRELRFQRVFSNNVVQDPSGPQWRFGLAGVPMRVVERPRPQGPLEPGNIAAERNTTPYFWMLDGSRVETTYVDAPNHQVPPSLVKVQTSNFWRYNRQTRTLRMPDGLVAEYGADGYLTAMRDAFDNGGTNVVRLTWSMNALLVEQFLGNGETREVSVQLDEATKLPTALSYLGRTWTFRYDAPGQLARADPPAGPGWSYEYSTDPFSAGKIARVTTPQGGEVEYVYEDRKFLVPGSAPMVEVFNVLVARRASSLGRVGEWTFDQAAITESAFSRTTVTLPSGTRLVYFYGAFSPSANVLAGGWQLRFRYVQDSDASIVEQEERKYALLTAARQTLPWGVPRLSERAITRDGRTHSTGYGFSSADFHDYHHPTSITERGPDGAVRRATQLTYDHFCHISTCDGPQFLGLPNAESVTINGMVAARAWMHDQTTGFRQSETLYGITTTFAPDAFGNVATVTKANGKSTAFTYSWGVVRSTSTPGVVVERSINQDGTFASETIANRTTHYRYDDPLGRLTSTQPPGATSPITVEYDNATGRRTTATRGASVRTTTTDGFGRPIETEDGGGTRTRVEYDPEGRKTYQSYPFTTAEVGTTTSYDSLGRVVQEANPDGTSRSWQYDDADNAITVGDEDGRTTRFVYRGFGHPDDARLASVIDANAQEWVYTYDAIGNIVQVATPTGHTRTWQRNASGLVTSETHPESGTVFYTLYDAAGVLKRKVDARGTEFVYQHDGNDRLTRISAGTRVTSIGYEPGSDNRVSMSNGSVSTTFDYDAAGRLAHRRDVVGAYVFDSRYAYDGNDRVTAVTYPSGRVVGYERADSEGRITRVFESATGRDHARGIGYHPSGALASYTAGNGIVTAVDYDPRRYWVRDIAAGPLRFTYGEYDNAGNVLAVNDSRGGAWTQRFTYDSVGRLASAQGPYGSTAYAYDAHGNRRSAFGSTYVYDESALRLTAQNGVPFGYDNNGNLTSTPAATYAYTPENWLATVTGSGVQAAYLYDADGWRTRKSLPGDTTFYLRGQSGELLSEWHALGATARARDYVYAGSRLIGAIDKPVTSTACGGEAIPNGSPTSLTVPAGGTVTFTFEGSACRKVSASIRSSTVGNCLLIYHKLRILNPDGSILASFNGVCAGDIVGPVVLPTSGIYTVSVYAYGPYSGNVTVSVYDIVDVTGPISFGQAVNATLDTPGQRGYWTFTGAANQRVSAVVHASNLPNCGIYNYFAILNANGAVVGSSSWNTCSGSIIGPFTLPTTGTYYLTVDPYKSGTGQVAVALYDVLDVTGPISLDGSPLTAALSTPGQRARWTFDGIANQRVSVVSTVSTVPQCGIYNSFGFLKPDGSALQTQWDLCAGAIVGPVTLPTTGTYTVLVDPAAAFTGQVTVKAYNIVDVTGSATVNGPPVSAQLTTPGQRGRWTFSGTAGQRVRAAVNSSTVPQCSVYNSFGILKPDGSALGTQWNMCAGTVTAQFTLPTDGVYTLLVDPAGSSTGSVTARVIDPVLLVNGTAPPTGVKVAPSTTVSVQVTGGPGNATDLLTLAAVGSSNNSYLAHQNVPTSGAAMSFKMPATPGTYEFRLFVAGSTARLATSSTVTVQ